MFFLSSIYTAIISSILHLLQKQYTPLHLAALSKKHLAAQLLIGHGADVTVIGGLVRRRLHNYT